tara:strand:- start:2113 stop:2811 length:699 start_codon:yes stop_codon:yes gene_type:complete
MNMQKKFTHIAAPVVLEEVESYSNSTGGRYYNAPGGRKYPSVTTVTGWEKSAFFAEWRRKNPEESKRVLKRGNDLHQVIEDYLSNKEIDLMSLSPTVSSLFIQMKDTLDNIDNIQALETALWSDTMCLAGRVDCIAEYNGVLSVIDFKGSTKQKEEKDILNYYLQGAAYAIMWQERTKVPINEFNVIVASENGVPCEVFTGKTFKYVPKLYQAIKKYHDVHPPIAPKLPCEA